MTNSGAIAYGTLKKWFFPLSFGILLLLTTSIHAEAMQTLIIDFDRQLVEIDNREQASGTIYYLPPHKLTVVVDEPIHQWMLFGKKRLEIYYPDEQKAFRFNSAYPFQLSFFEAFIGVLSKDYGLSDLGYVLVHRSVTGDTITTTWKPPKPLAKALGEFILVYEKDKIIRAESKKVDGTITSRCTFGNHFEFKDIFFPFEITTIRFFESDSTVESILFSNPEFNGELPQHIIYFTIPSDAAIEESEW
jgi:outer membrane lipoprotein-sorting protein